MNVCHPWTGLWDITQWKVGPLSWRSRGFKPPPPPPFPKRCKWSTKLSLLIVRHRFKVCGEKRKFGKMLWLVGRMLSWWFFKQSFTMSRCPIEIILLSCSFVVQTWLFKEKHALVMLAWHVMHVQYCQHWLAFQRRLCMPVFVVRPG